MGSLSERNNEVTVDSGAPYRDSHPYQEALLAAVEEIGKLPAFGKPENPETPSDAEVSGVRKLGAKANEVVKGAVKTQGNTGKGNEEAA